MKRAGWSIKKLFCLASYKWSERWSLVAAPCIQTSRAAGLHAPGRGLAEKATLPKASWGGGTSHSVNPAHKSSWSGGGVGEGHQRGEARSNTSEEEPQGREEESFGLNEIFKKPTFFMTSFFPGFYKLCVVMKRIQKVLWRCRDREELLLKNSLCPRLSTILSF